MRQITMTASAMERQLHGSFHPDDYDDRGEPYVTKGMTEAQIEFGLRRKAADEERRSNAAQETE